MNLSFQYCINPEVLHIFITEKLEVDSTSRIKVPTLVYNNNFTVSTFETNICDRGCAFQVTVDNNERRKKKEGITHQSGMVDLSLICC